MQSSTIRAKKWRSKHPEKSRAASQAYYHKNAEKRKKYYARWRKQNKSKINAYYQTRKANDPQFKIGCVLRTRLWMAVKQKTKKGSSVKDLGCSIPDLLKHLESLFQTGMTWDNYGEWHIDHVKPLASFDLSDRQQFLAACHYTNLQPLWAKENIAKGNKLALNIHPHTATLPINAVP